MAHVGRNSPESDVDVDEGGRVTLEPARLDRYRPAVDGPFGSVRGCWHPAACLVSDGRDNGELVHLHG